MDKNYINITFTEELRAKTKQLWKVIIADSIKDGDPIKQALLNFSKKYRLDYYSFSEDPYPPEGGYVFRKENGNIEFYYFVLALYNFHLENNLQDKTIEEIVTLWNLTF